MNDKTKGFIKGIDGLDKWYSKYYDRYSKPQKRRVPSFAEVIYDADFEIAGLVRLKEGEFAHCVFCGGRMKYPVLLRRLTDNTLWRVGKTCIGRVGLDDKLTGKEKTVVRVERSLRYREVEEQPKDEEDEDYCSLDEFF